MADRTNIGQVPLYFLLLLVIWLSVEKMFSTEPIVAFLDLFILYILVAFVS